MTNIVHNERLYSFEADKHEENKEERSNITRVRLT